MPALNTPERTTTTIGKACRECATISKSGKISCCARGGSWFRNCGGAGKARLQHTWYEGIQACKAWARSRIVIGPQANAADQKDIDSSHGDGKASSKGTVTAVTPFAANMSTPMAGTTPIITATSTSTAYATHSTTSESIAGAAITTISIPDAMATRTPSIVSDNTQGYENVALFIINLLITTAFQWWFFLITKAVTITLFSPQSKTTAGVPMSDKMSTLAPIFASDNSQGYRNRLNILVSSTLSTCWLS